MSDLQKRFEAVSGGRRVRIISIKNTFLNYDFQVSYQKKTDSYRAEFTQGGWFEEAYRFIERWIKKNSEKLDGTYKEPPDDYVDCRDHPMFWVIEHAFDIHLKDCQEALENQIVILENQRQGARIEALHGVISYLQTITDEVHTAVLSPRSMDFLRIIGLGSTIKG